MRFDDFTATISGDSPPDDSLLLLALWYDAKGDWERAHNIVQDIHTTDASWIHAYLHRKEGDLWNAGYWYRQAGKPTATGALQVEWETLVKAFL